MALHTNASATTAVPTAQVPPSASQSSQSSEWNWTTDGLAMPVTLASTSEAVAKLDAALAAITKGADQGTKVRLLSIDNTAETTWRYSAAVVAIHRPATNVVSYMPLLIEATESRPLEGVALPVNIGGMTRQITMLTFPSNAMDESYFKRIEELIASNFPQAQALYVQGMVVPKRVQFDDVETLKRILATAVRGDVTQLAEIDPGFPDNNLALLKRGDGSAATTVARLAVTSGSASGDPRDVFGAPTRQDVKLGLVATQPQAVQNQNPIVRAQSLNNNGATEENIGSLSAYLDVRVLPPMGNLYSQDMYAMTRRFVPELVITSVDLNKLATTAGLMMMVSTATAVADPRIWHSVLYQRTLAGRADYRNAAFDPTDLGALNLMSNIAREAQPSVYDLKSSNTGAAEFIDYVTRVFVQSLAISIDVPRMGPQSAYMSVLTDCAAGKPIALASLLASVNKLTGGKFSQLAFANTGGVGQLTREMVFSEVGNAVYNGYYQQKVGDSTREVDLRHVDTIALLNRFGQQNPDMVNKWAQSYLTQAVDPILRMAQRKDVTDAYTQDGAVYTGVSDRLTFNINFLAAIAQCNIQNGFQPTLEFRDALAGTDTGLQAPAFMQNGLFTGSVPGVVNAAAGGIVGAGGAFMNMTATRF